MTATLTRKDSMELAYWKNTDLAYHRAKNVIYMWAFGHYKQPQSILEIGCGPLGGILPFFLAHRLDPDAQPRRVGVDPLIEEYWALGNLPSGPEYISAHFEEWQTEERFDAIFAIDALDHGEMGLALLPKIESLLNPGGRFYLHLHFRPDARLNEIHDHKMTVEDLDYWLSRTNLVELRRDWYPRDVDDSFDCPTLVAVWERP